MLESLLPALLVWFLVAALIIGYRREREKARQEGKDIIL